MATATATATAATASTPPSSPTKRAFSSDGKEGEERVGKRPKAGDGEEEPGVALYEEDTVDWGTDDEYEG